MLRGSIIVVVQALCLSALPSLADHIPQACYDGHELMGDDDHAAVAALTECIANPHLTIEASALAHYNRSAAHLAIYFKEDDEAIGLTQLERAFDDIEVAIELDPDDGDAYCLRGQIDLEGSLGFYGDEDIDKGIELGGRAAVCDDPY